MSPFDDPKVLRDPQAIMSNWPDGLRSIFVDCSLIISASMQELEENFKHRIPSRDRLPDCQKIMWYLLSTIVKTKEAPITHMHFTNAVPSASYVEEILAQEMAIAVGPREENLVDDALPYQQTISVLLGRQAVGWLAAKDVDGRRKLNPDEASRERWYELRTLKSQIQVEDELQALDSVSPYTSKIVVGAAWTMASLMTFMDPRVFVVEGNPYVSSVRYGDVSVSLARHTHIYAEFAPISMINVVKVLKLALDSQIVSAPDMMWIGASFPQLLGHTTTFSTVAVNDPEPFEIFLSHRGKDAKRALMSAVFLMRDGRRIFLDCLKLGTGLINRHFVFRSLVRSRRILLVQTDNFWHSEWCRKEAWLAQTLSDLHLSSVMRVNSIHDLVGHIGRLIDTNAPDPANLTIKRGANTSPPGFNQDEWERVPYGSGITFRILKDIDYWARAPNLYSAQKKGLDVELLVNFREWLKAQWVTSSGYDAKTISNEILSLLEKILPSVLRFEKNEAGNVEAKFYVDCFDLIAAAMQLSVGAMCSRAHYYSKTGSRRSFDTIARASYNVCMNIDECGAFDIVTASFYLRLAACVIALELSPNDKFVVDAVQTAVRPPFLLREDTVLLDARVDSPKRNGLLRYVSILAYSDLGNIGVFQDGTDPIHHQIIAGRRLDILPCVTQYSGMERLFAAGSKSGCPI
jgi:hypothetical protein